MYGHFDHDCSLVYGQFDHKIGVWTVTIATLLSRTDYCKLVGLEVEQLNALRRRGQLPLVPNAYLPEEVANERGYSPGSALSLIMANELTERYEMSRDCAARIAAYGLRAYQRWGDIFVTSAQVAAAKEPAFDVLFAVIDWHCAAPDRKNRTAQKVGVGTLREIAAQFPDAREIIAISVTRCAALLRQRAAKARIELGDFWATA
jgi:hypothetical protein